MVAVENLPARNRRFSSAGGRNAVVRLVPAREVLASRALAAIVGAASRHGRLVAVARPGGVLRPTASQCPRSLARPASTGPEPPTRSAGPAAATPALAAVAATLPALLLLLAAASNRDLGPRAATPA